MKKEKKEKIKNIKQKEEIIFKINKKIENSVQVQVHIRPKHQHHGLKNKK